MSKLAAIRNRSGLTQRQLASKSGLTVSYISKIEYGERSAAGISLRNAVKLADALGVQDLRELLDE